MTGLRFILLQAVLACGLATLWFTGILPAVIAGESRWFCGAIWAVGMIGLGFVAKRRYSDADWLADNLLPLAVIGMQVGIIAGLGVAAKAMGSGSDVVQSAGAFFAAITVALNVSVSALAGHLWLKLNIRMLDGRYG